MGRVGLAGSLPERPLVHSHTLNSALVETSHRWEQTVTYTSGFEFFRNQSEQRIQHKPSFTRVSVPEIPYHIQDRLPSTPTSREFQQREHIVKTRVHDL